MDFAKHLQSLRKKAGLSQEDIAEQLHISRQAVSKWEIGQSTPDIDTCVKLCNVLNVTPNQLLLGSEIQEELAAPESKNTFFLIASVFLMLVCACGTIILVCNLYNGKLFEPKIHTLAIIMIWGSLFVFSGVLLHYLRKNTVLEKGSNACR